MSLLSRFFSSPRPAVALEITARQVTAARLGDGAPPAVEATAVVPLPAGAVVPALSAANMADAAVVASAVKEALDRTGAARHVALVIPDAVARVAIVKLEEVPARAADLDALLRWHVRKSLPFKLDEAQVTYGSGPATLGPGREFLVVAARRDIVAEYEAPCLAAGAHPGLVDLATTSLVNLQLAAGAPEGDWLLVHLAPDSATLAVVRGGQVIFHRHRGAEGSETVADLAHQTAMYYEDRLQGTGLGRVVVAGAESGPGGPEGAEAVRREIADRLGARVEALDPSGVVALNGVASASGLREQLAPLLGCLLRKDQA